MYFELGLMAIEPAK